MKLKKAHGGPPLTATAPVPPRQRDSCRTEVTSSPAARSRTRKPPAVSGCQEPARSRNAHLCSGEQGDQTPQLQGVAVPSARALSPTYTARVRSAGRGAPPPSSKRPLGSSPAGVQGSRVRCHQRDQQKKQEAWGQGREHNVSTRITNGGSCFLKTERFCTKASPAACRCSQFTPGRKPDDPRTRSSGSWKERSTKRL